MDNIPILPFILQSLPESFVIILFGLALTGSKANPKNTFMAAALATLFCYIIRSLPITFGIHTILQLAFIILMVYLIQKYSIIRSVISVIMGSILFGALETITFYLLLAMPSVYIQDILANPWHRVVVSLPHTILIGTGAILMLKYKISPVPIKKIESITQQQKKPGFYLTIIGMLQAFLLFSAIAVLLVDYSDYYNTPDRFAFLVFITTILFISAITTIAVAYYMLRSSMKQIQLESEYRHLKGLESIYHSVKQQQHDFINHVASIYGLLKAGENTSALKYIEGINTKVKKNQELLNLKAPALSGLLRIKNLQADEMGISFNISVDHGFFKISVEPADLTGIVGNLLDNALDAAQALDSHPLSIWLELMEKNGRFIIAVENTGATMPIDSNIFKAGFTTKSKNRHSGLGLYTVITLVKKHKGQIKIDAASQFPGTRFEIIF